MAHKKDSSESKPESKAAKKILRRILTARADDGGFVHEHHYEDEKGTPDAPRYGGVSTSMEDLHRHMDDHFGAGAEGTETQEAPGAEAAEPQQENPAAEAAEPQEPPTEPQQ
jgi:hypothetical protein